MKLSRQLLILQLVALFCELFVTTPLSPAFWFCTAVGVLLVVPITYLNNRGL